MYLEYWYHSISPSQRITLLSRTIRDNLGLQIKRIVDVLGAVMLLVFSTPVLLLPMILIRLTSDGPALFKQERLGLNRRPFVMWKLRTMTLEAAKLEEGLRRRNPRHGPFFKVKNDPRVTRVGKFLRKYSIDELPQLINVLKGEMSLVGPRPIPVKDFEFQQFKEWKQFRRFSVKPGLTGIWQVSGRSNTSDKMRMQYDMEYVQNWSLLLDIKILFKTIPAVLEGDGAE